MIIAILAFLFVTFLFSYLGICIVKEVKGRQKGWALLFVFAGWASIVAYAIKLAGLWEKPIDTSAPIPDWFMVPFCVLFLTAPLTIPLIMGIREIWRAGGRNSDLPPLFFDGETSIGFLYFVSLGLSFYLTDRFGIHMGWMYPISLPVLLVLFLAIASFFGTVCWLTTQLARRFSPAARRSRKIENK